MSTLIFPEDGWYRFEKFDQLLFVRGMPVNSLGRSGHYHQDLGHFSLFKSGVPVLVDGGRKTYSDDFWGKFGVRPEAHNTITIDDYGLSPHKSTRFPSKYSDAPYTISNMENDELLQVDIHAFGFRRIHPAIRWYRTIKMCPEQFEVQDTIGGIDSRLITTFFHFSNTIEINNKLKNSFYFYSSSVSGVFQHSLVEDQQVDIYKGGESPLGWQAIAYGKVVPAPTATVRELKTLPAQNSYTIIWGKD